MTSAGSTAHVFDSMFQQRDIKILGLPVLQRMSGRTLYPRGPCSRLQPMDKGNEGSGNEIATSQTKANRTARGNKRFSDISRMCLGLRRSRFHDEISRGLLCLRLHR